MGALAPIPPKPPATFITFYSFKGGVGRSLCLLNVACLLARSGVRVLMIDFDLEAPGITTLWDQRILHGAEKPTHVGGLVELITDAKEYGLAGVLGDKDCLGYQSRYVVDIDLPDYHDKVEGGCLHLLPAGRVDDTYGLRLGSVDFSMLYSAGVGQEFFAYFKHIIKQSDEYEYVLIDSRTGFSDETGICTRDLADHIVVVTGLNHQNRAGTIGFLKRLKANHWEKVN
jgi:cellulose biosynthesis protein BcsQ